MMGKHKDYWVKLTPEQANDLGIPADNRVQFRADDTDIMGPYMTGTVVMPDFGGVRMTIHASQVIQ